MSDKAVFSPEGDIIVPLTQAEQDALDAFQAGRDIIEDDSPLRLNVCKATNTTLTNINAGPNNESFVSWSPFQNDFVVNSNNTIYGPIDDAGITFLKSGWFLVMCNIHCVLSTNSRVNVGVAYTIDGTPLTNIVGLMGETQRLFNGDEINIQLTDMIQINAGQKLGLAVSKRGSSGTVVTPSNTMSFTVMRVE